MGSFSICCAVSGLPIDCNHKIVGFKLEPCKYSGLGGKNKWVPASWPIIGEYDTYGGIEGEETDGPFAFIHLDVWKKADIFWHKENRSIHKESWLDSHIEEAVTDAKKELVYQETIYQREYKYTFNDALFYKLRDSFQKSDYGLVFREMIQSKCELGIPEGFCFLERGNFMEIILTMIADGKWNKARQNILNKLVYFYSGQTIIGRPIAPSNQIWIEQCPDYKQRIKVLSLFSKTARKFQKELDRNREED